MKLFLILFSLSTMAHADCGLTGTLQERVANCKTETRNLSLVFQKEKSQAWLYKAESKIYFSKSGDAGRMSWNESASFCAQLSAQAELAGISSQVWTMPSYKAFPVTALMEGFREMRRPSSSFDEFRFWMAESVMHPSGQLWGVFYSNRGSLGRWFADAGDMYYRAVCVTPAAKASAPL